MGLAEKLKQNVEKNPIKFNLKLETTYNQPNVEDSSRDRSFVTSARAIYATSNLEKVIGEEFEKLIKDEDAYMGRGSGFILEKIDGVLLAIYRYTPLG
jgi:hypothetical protein